MNTHIRRDLMAIALAAVVAATGPTSTRAADPINPTGYILWDAHGRAAGGNPDGERGDLILLRVPGKPNKTIGIAAYPGVQPADGAVQPRQDGWKPVPAISPFSVYGAPGPKDAKPLAYTWVDINKDQGEEEISLFMPHGACELAPGKYFFKYRLTIFERDRGAKRGAATIVARATMPVHRAIEVQNTEVEVATPAPPKANGKLNIEGFSARIIDYNSRDPSPGGPTTKRKLAQFKPLTPPAGPGGPPGVERLELSFLKKK